MDSSISRIEPITFRDLPPLSGGPLPIYDFTPRDLRLGDEPSRPSLDIPGTAPRPFFTSLSVFLETLSSIESLYLDAVEGRIHAAQKTYIVNFEKRLGQNRALDEQVKSRDWWDFLHKIAACLLAATSMMIGATLLTTSSSPWEFAAGGAMIVSGVSTIAGMTLDQLQTHPELAAILTTTGAAIGLLGGAAVALYSTHTAQEMAGKVVVAAIGIVAHLSEVVKETNFRKIAEIKSANALISCVFEKQQDILTMAVNDAEFFSTRMADNVQLCANIQRKQEQAIRKIISAQQEIAG